VDFCQGCGTGKFEDGSGSADFLFNIAQKLYFEKLSLLKKGKKKLSLSI
jgi:hypothetical protein